MLIIDLIQGLVVELIRALLIEELCQRVRKHAERRAAMQKRRRLSERAVHSLTTARRAKP